MTDTSRPDERPDSIPAAIPATVEPDNAAEDPVGTVRIHFDDNPKNPNARRRIAVDATDYCGPYEGCRWQRLTGVANDHLGSDPVHSDSVMGWPIQPLAEVALVLGHPKPRIPVDLAVVYGFELGQRDVYSTLLDLCGFVEDGELSAAGSADNDLAAERADAVMEFISLAKGSMLPRKLLPVDPRPTVDGDLRERAEDLWSSLDWTLWGHGLGDVLRERMADTMLAALPAADLDQALQLMQAWKERRGYPVMHEQFAQLRATNKSLLAMLERMETQHVTFFGPDGEEFHPDWCRECRVDKARAELDEVRASCTRVAREFDSLHGRYTVGPSNALRVVDLLLGDITQASIELRKAAEAANSERSASCPAVPADAEEQFRRALEFPQMPRTVEDAASKLVAIVRSWLAPAVGSDVDYGEFVRAAHRLVHAAGSMRDHWAEANDGSTGGRARRQELWRNLHARADDLSEVLPDWVPPSDVVEPDTDPTAACSACPRGDCEDCDGCTACAESVGCGACPDATSGTWRPGDLALDRTNFVWWRDHQGWRPIVRYHGYWLSDRDLGRFVGPISKLTGLPPEMNTVGSVPAEVVARLRAVPAEQEGGNRG